MSPRIADSASPTSPDCPVPAERSRLLASVGTRLPLPADETKRQWLWPALAAAGLLVAVAGTAVVVRKLDRTDARSGASRVVRLAITLPEGDALVNFGVPELSRFHRTGRTWCIAASTLEFRSCS